MRDKILSKLKDTLTPPAKEPTLDIEPTEYNDLLNTFIESLKLSGGEAVILNSESELQEAIYKTFNTKEYIDATKELHLSIVQEAKLALFSSNLAVAENGAVYLNNPYPRELITLARDLAIIIDAKDIVSNMHQAYSKIDLRDSSYSLFLSGPSKTADIEQSLVIGAHGAIRVVIFIVDKQAPQL